jgi:hypothetical protein
VDSAELRSHRADRTIHLRSAAAEEGFMDDVRVDEIVIADRTMCRVLALLPAVVVAVAVRVLTLTTPPLNLRVVAAAVTALACWTAYRLLTARVAVRDTGVHVRGVLFEADIPWSELQGVSVAPSGGPVRALVWGLMQPHTLRLETGSKTLRPVAGIGTDEDDDVQRVLGAIRVRMGAWGIPAQRPAQERIHSR